jgi:hypothetical protein
LDIEALVDIISAFVIDGEGDDAHLSSCGGDLKRLVEGDLVLFHISEDTASVALDEVFDLGALKAFIDIGGEDGFFEGEGFVLFFGVVLVNSFLVDVNGDALDEEIASEVAAVFESEEGLTKFKILFEDASAEGFGAFLESAYTSFERSDSFVEGVESLLLGCAKARRLCKKRGGGDKKASRKRQSKNTRRGHQKLLCGIFCRALDRAVWFVLYATICHLGTAKGKSYAFGVSLLLSGCFIHKETLGFNAPKAVFCEGRLKQCADSSLSRFGFSVQECSAL